MIKFYFYNEFNTLTSITTGEYTLIVSYNKMKKNCVLTYSSISLNES